jgi:UDP-glucose:(heptosyl)LPS alpha-1,3-glucosyltransferase
MRQHRFSVLDFGFCSQMRTVIPDDARQSEIENSKAAIMKIGLVRRGYSKTGGAERYLRRFADAAAAAGHGFLLFTSDDWPASAWEGEIVRLPGRSPQTFADDLQRANPRAHCDLIFSFERIVQCDVYRAGDGVHAAWLARRAAFEPRWKSLFRSFRSKHRALLQLEKRLFSNNGARLVITNSRMVQREIEQHFGFPASKIRIVYNGVPQFRAAADARAVTRAALGLKESDYVALFAGSGWERKGLRFAIQAIKLVERNRPVLLVAGTGKRQRNDAGVNVRFLGARQDMEELLAAADVFVLPTLYDPFSNACLEAAAAGVPLITTRHNGFSEVMVSGRDGEIIDDPRDVRAIGQALERWSSPELRAAAQPTLRALGARFSIDENVRQTLDALLSCPLSG